MSRSQKKTLIYLAKRLGVLRAFERKQKNRLRILTYHRFSKDYHPLCIQVTQFEEHLEYLTKYCSVISLDAALGHLKEGLRLPPYPVVVTIDDGYSDAYEIAFPILNRFKVPATIYSVIGLMQGRNWLWTDIARYLFLTTQRNELEIALDGEELTFHLGGRDTRLEQAGRLNERLKRMRDGEKNAALNKIASVLGIEIPDRPTPKFAGFDARQAREMDAAGIRIESHTVSHPLMTKVDYNQMLDEARASKSELESILDRPVSHFCYPDGAFNGEAIRAVREAGYTSAVTTKFGTCNTGDDPFSLKRLEAPPDILDLLQNITGIEGIKRKIRRIG